MTDQGGDGICCSYRRGWIALTAFKAVQEPEVVWSNNGEYGAGIQAYLQIDANGMVSQATETSPI